MALICEDRVYEVASVSLPHLGGYIIGGDPGTWCPQVWERIIADHEVRSVIDVGCGEGQITKWFADSGLRVLGIEGSWEAIASSETPHLMIEHDYTTGPLKTDDAFDLAWCSEFVEHVDERFSGNILDTLKRAKRVALTHAMPGQEGYHHVNCREADYWIQKLADCGFAYDREYSQRLRGLTDAWHVHRSLMFFHGESKL